MRTALRTLAFLVGLLPTLAVGQVAQFPQNLPANTVVGRMGVGPGPAQAIPFGTFESALGGNADSGTFYGNPTNSAATKRSFTIQSLPDRGTPDAANDRIPIYNSATGKLNSVSPSALSVPQAILLSVCNTASSFLWNSAGTWVCQSAAQVSNLLGLPLSIAFYTAGGTSNDTTGVQAAFTACGTLGGCTLTCVNGATYTVDTISVPSNVTVLGKSCLFKARTLGQATFDLNGVSQVVFDGVRIKGTISALTGSTPTGSDNAINIRGGSSYVWVLKSYITGYAFFPVYFENSTHIYIDGNSFPYNAFGPRCRGSSFFSISRNDIYQTNMYSTTPTSSQFSTGPALDSTDGHSFGVCHDGHIDGNTITNYPYSQGILIHAGYDLSVVGNVLKNVSIGISLNPFNSTDTLSFVTVSANTMDGTLATSLPTSSDAGIVVQGCGSTPVISYVTVTGNVIHAFNRVSQDTGLGGIAIACTSLLTVSGNVIQGVEANGIVIAGAEKALVISGNNIDTVLVKSSTQNGIYFKLTGVEGAVSSNLIRTLTDASGAGVKYATGITTTDIKESNTACISVTNCTVGP